MTPTYLVKHIEAGCGVPVEPTPIALSNLKKDIDYEIQETLSIIYQSLDNINILDNPPLTNVSIYAVKLFLRKICVFLSEVYLYAKEHMVETENILIDIQAIIVHLDYQLDFHGSEIILKTTIEVPWIDHESFTYYHA